MAKGFCKRTRCESGFELHDNACIKKYSKEFIYRKGKWVKLGCDDGYTIIAGKCVRYSCPKGYTLNGRDCF